MPRPIFSSGCVCVCIRVNPGISHREPHRSRRMPSCDGTLEYGSDLRLVLSNGALSDDAVTHLNDLASDQKGPILRNVHCDRFDGQRRIRRHIDSILLLQSHNSGPVFHGETQSRCHDAPCATTTMRVPEGWLHSVRTASGGREGRGTATRGVRTCLVPEETRRSAQLSFSASFFSLWAW